jgi:hypothetical protein
MTSTENAIAAASNRLLAIESALDNAVQAALTALHSLDLPQDTMDDIEFHVREAIEHSAPEVFISEVKRLSEIIHDPCAETRQSMIDHIRDRKKAPD